MKPKSVVCFCRKVKMESKKQKLSPNPREYANIFSILSFSWTFPFFKKGFSKDLELDDIFEPLKSDESDLLGDRLEKWASLLHSFQKLNSKTAFTWRKWNKELESESKNPSLVRATAKTFWKELLILATACFVNDVLIKVGQPFLLGKLLLYFRYVKA